jgi:hypothetical protein
LEALEISEASAVSDRLEQEDLADQGKPKPLKASTPSLREVVLSEVQLASRILETLAPLAEGSDREDLHDQSFMDKLAEKKFSQNINYFLYYILYVCIKPTSISRFKQSEV